MSTAHAADSMDPPRLAVGGGVGFIGLLHVDYSHWVARNTSVDLGLTPLIYLDVGGLGLTQHVPFSSSASSEHNLVVSGMVTGLVGIMDGSPAVGPGARAGYEWLGEHLGVSATLGAVYVVGQGDSLGEGDVAPDVRLTMWFVWR